MIQEFFYMHGYGWYVFISYGCVLTFLLLQWLLPWRTWRQHLRTLQDE
jgi:heme exporter protein D